MKSPVWAVALYEYTRHVLRRRFVFAVLSIPALIALTIGVAYLAIQSEENLTPGGYVDLSGTLADPRPAPPDPSRQDAPLIPYVDEAGARAALDAGDIQAYYVVAGDYAATGRVDLVYRKQPSRNVTSHMYRFLQANLLSGRPPEIAARAAGGDELTIRAPDGSREFGETPTAGQLMPLIAGFAFVMLIFMTSSYIMQAVADEKENRTMEILVTSISPGQLLTGKVLGTVAIGFTLLATWIAVGALAAGIGGALGLVWLQDLRTDVSTMLLMLLVLVPAFVLVAALMAAIGATVTEAQEGQQMTGIIVLPFMIPVYLIVPLMEYPHSPFSIGLTLFPITAPLTIVVRSTFTVVPAWQYAAASAIITACAVGAAWLAGRAFRLGMLRYGQRLDLRELLGRAPRVPAGEVRRG